MSDPLDSRLIYNPMGRMVTIKQIGLVVLVLGAWCTSAYLESLYMGSTINKIEAAGALGDEQNLETTRPAY